MVLGAESISRAETGSSTGGARARALRSLINAEARTAGRVSSGREILGLTLSVASYRQVPRVWQSERRSGTGVAEIRRMKRSSESGDEGLMVMVVGCYCDGVWNWEFKQGFLASCR